MAGKEHTAMSLRPDLPFGMEDLIEQTSRLLDAADIGLTGLREVSGSCSYRLGVAECLTLARANFETIRAWASGSEPRWDVEADAQDFLKIVAAVRKNTAQPDGRDATD